jgi:hypothetical protein
MCCFVFSGELKSFFYLASGNLLLSRDTKVGKKSLEKILVILIVFYVLVVNTEAVPPSLKLGILI